VSIGLNRSRRWASVAVVALLFVGISACSSSGGSSATTADSTTGTTTRSLTYVREAPGTPKAGGTLRFGLFGETNGWSPVDSNWAGSGYIVAQTMFDRLVMFDDKGQPKPYLAESIDPSADFTRWTIKVRPGVTFHDGSPLDADVVKYNLEKNRSSVVTGPVFATVTSIDVVDPLTVAVSVSKPWSNFPVALTGQSGFVAARSMLDSPDGSRHPVGTGPFVFDSWTPDNNLQVHRNPNYWRKDADGAPLPYLDKIDFRVLADPQALSNALDSGGVDVIEASTPELVDKYVTKAAGGGTQIFTGHETSETVLALNTAKAPFDDPLARRILATGIDTASQGNLLKGIFTPARGPFLPDSPYYTDTSYPQYDQAEAQRLADEYKAAHGGQPLQFSITVTPAPEIVTIAQAGQEQLRQIGVEMTINQVEQTKLIVDALQGNYEATGWVEFSGASLESDYVFISDPSIRPLGQLSLNLTRNANPRLTAALDAARATSDAAQQVAQYKIVQEEMAKDLNYIFIVHNRLAIASTANVIGLSTQTFPDGTLIQVGYTPLLTQVWLAS